MAEIKIEKKKSIWPIIVLILLGLGLIWYFFMRNPDNKVVNEENRTERAVVYDNGDRNSAIALYSAYLGDNSQMGINHEYSHGALIHLINAVEEKAEMLNVDLKADLGEARDKADEITKNPNETNHADLIKSSGVIITRALTTLQKAKFPNLSSEAVKVDAAVSAIDTSVKTLDQKEVVNNFFKSAESLLLKMK